MSYPQSKGLILIQLAFRKQLKGLESALDANAVNQLKPEIFNYEPLLDQDIEQIKAIQFFGSLITLINTSIFLKLNGSAKKITDKAKSITQLNTAHINTVTQYAEMELETPDLLAGLSEQTSFRHGLYYLLLLSLLHKGCNSYWTLKEPMVIALCKTAPTELEKQFLLFITYYQKLSGGSPHRLHFKEELMRLKNPFFQALTTINALSDTGGPTPARIAALSELLTTPFTFPEHAAPFVVQHIRILFAMDIVKNLTEASLKPETLHTLLHQFSTSSFYPPHARAKSAHWQHPLDYIFALQGFIAQFIQIYTPYFDDSMELELQFGQLRFNYLKLGLQFEDQKLPENSYQYIETSIELLFTRHFLEYSISNDSKKDPYFWQQIYHLLNPTPSRIRRPFHTALLRHMDLVLENFGRLENFEAIQAVFKIYQHDAKHQNQKSKAEILTYSSLQKILELIHFITSLCDQDEKDSLEGTLLHLEHFDKLQLTLAAFNMNPEDTLGFTTKHFKHLFQSVKSALTHQLQRLSNAIKDTIVEEHEASFLTSLRHALYRTFKFLHVNHEESDALNHNLRFHEVDAWQAKHVDALSHAKKACAKKKGGSKKPVAKKAASAFHLFKPLPENNIIAAAELPKALLEFAKLVREHFKKDLILTGGAVTHLLLKRDNASDYDCLMFDVTLEKMLEFVLAHHYVNPIIVGHGPSVLKFSIPKEDGALIPIDLVVEKRLSPCLETDMLRILAWRDFKMSALFCVLTAARELKVQGFRHAIRSVNLKAITIVEGRVSVFEEDPIRLFRFIKISLQYPDFKADDFLKGILRRSTTGAIFERYLVTHEEATLNAKKIGTAIENLFSRFEFEKVLALLVENGITSALTGFSTAEIALLSAPLADFSIKFHAALKAQYPQLCDGYIQKAAFYIVMVTYFCRQHADIENLKAWPFMKVATCLRPKEQALLSFVKNEMLGYLDGGAICFMPSVYGLIQAIKALDVDVEQKCAVSI